MSEIYVGYRKIKFQYSGLNGENELPFAHNDQTMEDFNSKLANLLLRKFNTQIKEDSLQWAKDNNLSPESAFVCLVTSTGNPELFYSFKGDNAKESINKMLEEYDIENNSSFISFIEEYNEFASSWGLLVESFTIGEPADISYINAEQVLKL